MNNWSQPLTQEAGDGGIRSPPHPLEGTRGAEERLKASRNDAGRADEESLAVAEELLEANVQLAASEQELLKTAARLEAANDLVNLLASTGIAAVFVDRDMRVRRFTPSAGALLGLTRDDVGQDIGQVRSMGYEADMLSQARQVLAQGTTVDREVGDPEGRCHSRRISPCRTEDGQIEGVVLTYFDITELKRAQRELRGLNERLESRVAERTIELERQKLDIARQQQLLSIMLRSVSEGVVIVDRNGRVLMENAAAIRIVGYSAREVGATHWCEAVGACWADNLRPLSPEEMPLMRACGGEEVGIQELLLRGAARDRDIMIEMRASPLHGVDNEIVGAIANFNDITERKRAAAVQARLAALVQSTRAAVITWDTQGKVVDWNDGAARLFGYTAAEMAGRELSLLSMAGERRELGGGGDPTQTLYDRELVMRHKDGHPVHVAWTATLVRDEKGKVVSAAGVGADVSERARLERQVARLAAEQRRELGQEVHDSLGQQLTAIGLLVGTLISRLGAGDSVAKVTSNLERCVDIAKAQLRNLVKGLAPVEVDAHGLQLALAELAKGTSLTHAVACTFQCPQPVALHDSFTANELYLIAREAVHNAVKHGKPLSIVIRLDSSPGLQLQVRDDGVGIARTSESRCGDGMGLRIMRYRSRLIGARLTVLPCPQGGTVLTCALQEEPSPGEVPASSTS